jgi:hypothetical protein
VSTIYNIEMKRVIRARWRQSTNRPELELEKITAACTNGQFQNAHKAGLACTHLLNPPTEEELRSFASKLQFDPRVAGEY